MRTSQQIKASIKAIATAAGKIQDRIQAITIECVEHAQEHGDATLMGELIKALPSGQRVTTLREYVIAHTPIRWNKDGDVAMVSKESKLYTPFNLDGMKEAPYWVWGGKETVQKPLTLEAIKAIVNNLNKRLDKQIEKDNVEGDVNVMKAYIDALNNVEPPKPTAITETEQSVTDAETVVNAA